MKNAKELQMLESVWDELYPNEDKSHYVDFIADLEQSREQLKIGALEPEWYKDTVVYSLYVDLFNKDFPGLEAKLDYLQELGVSTLWLLPILDSPMRDAGFDIRNYTSIRKELMGLPEGSSEEDVLARFDLFLQEAHKRNIKVIFDIAMNHCSEEHPFFVEARKSKDNPYRDYFIWNKDTDRYKETRLLFKGMCPSNWEKDEDEYFFHRFFEFQPDWNYRNPKVLLSMSENLIFWLKKGVDGFRADAIPYLWKEEGTDCENLPKTHSIIKWFRAVLEYLRPNTLLLAEACQPPMEVVKYFGENDECHAGYHFPIMPMIFKSLATGNKQDIIKTLSSEVTPEIKDNNQWFMFLRLHDELTLEMVTPEDRKLIHDHYCKKEEWDFRVGEGISSRLSELLDKDPQKIGLAYSIMLTLPGTPIVYYGDEFGKLNDEAFFESYRKMTGKTDTRYYVRGPMDWDWASKVLEDKDPFHYNVYQRITKQLSTRNQFHNFGRGDMEWIDFGTEASNSVLAYRRNYEGKEILVIQNLSDKDISISTGILNKEYTDLLDDRCKTGHGEFVLKAYAYHWFA
jgi:maltose alpha-D-glucosyltransferase/alpha-amylase